jgi:hypothetical protein
MRAPHFHIPRVAGLRLDGSSFNHRGMERPHPHRPKSLDRVDILALILAATLAAAVGVALMGQG